jgi:aldehyde dehydrogenase (NAD+)
VQAASRLSNYARFIGKDEISELSQPIARMRRGGNKVATSLIPTHAANQANIYREIFNRQKAHFASNITKSYEWRVDQLDRLARLLSEHTDEFYEALSRDFKTALSEKVFEVGATLGTIEVTKSFLKSWMQPIEAPVPKFLAASGHKAVVYREPYGVTLIMGPFNGPLLCLLRPAITALAAGNTCILKVSDAPNTGGLLMKLVPKYFAPEVLVAIAGGPAEAAELLRLPFDFIYFTGSSRVAKIVLRAAAENITPVLLELGGQNPVIVDQTANVPDAAKKLVWGATAWGGQWCTSPGYAYVHEKVADEFVAECRKAVIELYGENPKENPDYSRIISAHEVRRLALLVDKEKVIVGGGYDEAERYFAPTILYPVDWTDRVMQGEIFGPILPVLKYSSLQEVMAQIKSRPRPLAGYIFSKDQNTIDEFVSGFSFGGGAVNQTNIHVYLDSIPFGGVGESGIGSGNGKYGFDSMTHAKSILISPPEVSIDHVYPPYTMDKIQALNQWLDY